MKRELTPEEREGLRVMGDPYAKLSLFDEDDGEEEPPQPSETITPKH